VTDGELFHIGCYTAAGGGAGEGVTLARRDPATGALTSVGLAAATDSPSFVTRHPVLPVLYAANELDDGAVTAWAVAPDGVLTPLGSQPTGGAQPCHLAVSPSGRWLASANYGSGSVAVHPLDSAGVPGERADLAAHRGRGPHPDRQESAHAHMTSWDSGGRLWVVDLGVDTIFRYALDGGRLRPDGEPVRTPPGAGPRHLARGRDGWHYVTDELSGTVTAYQMDPRTGQASVRARVPASAEAGQVLPSEIAVDPTGRYLYLANRGPDTIAAFALVDGVPRPLGEVPSGGEWPRHFALWGGFLYVVNERSHTVVTMRIMAGTGLPVATGAVLEVPSPTCVAPPVRSSAGSSKGSPV